MTTIEFIPKAERFSGGIRELIVAANDEFVPPLSGREGTTQREGLAEATSDSEEIDEAIEAYHSQCMEQHLIVCHKEEEVQGFMSFRDGYRTPELEHYNPSNYISTIIVGKKYRRRGLARRMYEVILSEFPSEIESPYVSTRTWSTNHSHLTLLDELGFQNVMTLTDDRGPGIDTVYYATER